MGVPKTGFKQTTVKIPSATAGWDLEAWRYIPSSQGNSPHPVIILAHGLAANKRLGLDEYAEVYSSEGYACIVFDYRRWGGSDGTPRHVVKVSEQLEDYRTVINWVRRQPEFDDKKIVAWGSSFSGGHIMQISSEEPDLAAALIQCPYTGPTPPPSESDVKSSVLPHLDILRALFFAVVDVLKQSLGLEPYYVPVSSEPGGGGVLSAPGALKGYASIAKNNSHFPNEVNASCVFQFASYNPSLAAPSITTPLLIVVPESDNLCSIQAALDAARSTKMSEVTRVGGGHFDMYPRHSEFERTVQAQLAFLHKHVPI